MVMTSRRKLLRY